MSSREGPVASPCGWGQQRVGRLPSEELLLLHTLLVLPDIMCLWDGIKSLVTWGNPSNAHLSTKLKGRPLHWLGLAAGAL